MNPMDHYECWNMVLWERIDSTNFGGCDHLVSEVQFRGNRNKDGYTLTTTVLE